MLETGDMAQFSPEALLQLAREGNRFAYAALLQRVTPVIRAFLRKHLGDRADNEDLLQEILIAIHQSSHTFNTKRSFQAWMFAIARHKLQDYLRMHYRNRALREAHAEEISQAIHKPEPASPQAREMLDDMLEMLPEKQRRIVRLMKLEGYTARQVAERMQISVPAVKVSAHRAYRALARHKKRAS